MQISERLINKKLLIIFIVVTFIFFSLFIKLFYVQVINKDFYVAKAYSQWTRDLPFFASRGSIKDRNGIDIVSSTSTYTLYSRPNEIKNAESIAQKIYKIIGLDYDKTLEKLNKKGVSEVTIKKELSKDQILSLVKLDITGLYLTVNSKRIYPYSNFLCGLLGFVSQDNIGQTGLEYKYNLELTGSDGASFTYSDLVGRKLENSTVSYISPKDGLTLNLTIDYYYQSFVEKAVADALKMYDANKVSCIMMNANSGQVLAIAQAPTFDLNNVPRDNLDILNSQSKLSVICDVYEPGSTFKIITSAIGLENNKIKSSYYCPGFSVVDGQRIRCWKSIGHSSQNFEEGIANSCNCVFMDVALSCGSNVMYEYYDKFGLFNKTDIDFPGEVSSIKIKKENVKNVDLARMGFGQAIAITPLQLILAVCSIINGGTLYKPYIVDSIYDESLKKFAKKNNKVEVKKTVSKKTSDLMRKYLINVVENGGGKNAKIENYIIGGKTGTSQKYENGAIARGKYLSSFIGFTNIDNEDIVCLFLVDEPKGYAYYGSIVAAPFVKNIFQSILDYKGIKPTSGESESVVMPDLYNLKLQEALALLKKMNIDCHYEGQAGQVYYQIPEKGFEISTNQIVYFAVR